MGNYIVRHMIFSTCSASTTVCCSLAARISGATSLLVDKNTLLCAKYVHRFNPGCDLIKRDVGEQAYGVTFPLITTASGEKLGLQAAPRYTAILIPEQAKVLAMRYGCRHS